LEEYSIIVVKLTCLERLRFWQKKSRQVNGPADMESDRDRAASNDLDRKECCSRASSASYPLDGKQKAIFMDVTLYRFGICIYLMKRINPLTLNDSYSGRTATLTSKGCILYIYSTNIGNEYFKYDINSPFLSLQNAVCFIILTYLVPVLFTFYIQRVLKFEK